MKRIIIREPIWKAPRSIGIAEYKLADEMIVEITYENSSGERLYPDEYYLTKEKALTYPKKAIKNGLVLRIIPIQDLEVL